VVRPAEAPSAAESRERMKVPRILGEERKVGATAFWSDLDSVDLPGSTLFYKPCLDEHEVRCMLQANNNESQVGTVSVSCVAKRTLNVDC
jgi:hypothetical protein